MAENPFEMKKEHVKWQRSDVTTWTPHQENGQVYDVFALESFKTLNDLVMKCSTQYAKRELLVDETGNRLTFQQVYEAATNLSVVLREASISGLKKGDRVGVCAQNCFEWVISFMAASLSGMVVIPMNSWWTAREIEYAVKHSECKLVFADARRVERIRQVYKNLGNMKVVAVEGNVRKDDVVFANMWEWVSKGKTMEKVPPVTQYPDEPGMIMFTSGTTNFPKGVVLTHRGISHTSNVYDKVHKTVLAATGETNPAAQPAMMLNVPLFHATGLYAIFFASLLIGRKVVILRKWNPAKALELIERERITSFTGVPTMVLDMLNHPDLPKRDISCLKVVGSGGAPPPAGVAKGIQTKMKSLPAQGYGLTEVNCLATSISAQDYIQRPGSCGKAVPGLSIQIWHDEENNKELPCDQVGRVVMRGPTLMLEYLKDVAATKKAITPDGWFISGDYGYLDKDGFLFLTGRSQDLIIRGGENISARAVEEAVFAAFETVHECAVFGYAHPTLGEEVAIAIYMKEGQKPLTLEQIRKGCMDMIAGFMLPTGLTVFTEPLPRGATGKTVKKDIKEKLKNGKLNWVTYAKPKL